MFCSKCGKEILDEALICPNCGCATNNYSQTNKAENCNGIYSTEYPIIKEFAEKAKTIKTLGILATIFMFGIGLIFTIIILIQTKKYKIPEISTNNPNEIAEFEAAKRQYKLGYNLAGFPILAIALCFIIGAIIGMAGMY